MVVKEDKGALAALLTLVPCKLLEGILNSSKAATPFWATQAQSKAPLFPHKWCSSQKERYNAISCTHNMATV